eukprot:TRINITY_DN5790_c0_g1_i1.p1 TRINITY_DN5790_c0_g1~~TRINITY_DN5790_c0_g1_i1.p1  ORF type:complete len:347 (+),score=85.04 TRINITY_DN5790_c0_g1_i1:73-1113(+)
MLVLSLISYIFFFLMIRRPPRSTLSSSSAASDVYKRQVSTQSTGTSGVMACVCVRDEASRANLVSQLSALEAEIVITEVKNEELVDVVCVGHCLVAVNDESVLTCEYHEGMEVVKGAIQDRPLTLTFIAPNGLDEVSHTFEEPGPLMLRFSHRIKFLNDELNAVQEALLGSPKSKRKVLKGAVKQMEQAINGAQAAFAATSQTRRSRSPSSDGLELPDSPVLNGVNGIHHEDEISPSDIADARPGEFACQTEDDPEFVPQIEEDEHEEELAAIGNGAEYTDEDQTHEEEGPTKESLVARVEELENENAALKEQLASAKATLAEKEDSGMFGFMPKLPSLDLSLIHI